MVNHHRKVPYRMIHCDSTLSAGDPEAGNRLVQGDTLQALRALLPYYAGKVKIIYIDPPDNTGAEGWAYNDNSPEMPDWPGGRAVYLLFAAAHPGTARQAADNVLTADRLAQLPAPPGGFDGLRVIYAEGRTVTQTRTNETNRRLAVLGSPITKCGQDWVCNPKSHIIKLNQRLMAEERGRVSNSLHAYSDASPF